MKINKGGPPSVGPPLNPHLTSFKATRLVCPEGALARPCTILVLFDHPPLLLLEILKQLFDPPPLLLLFLLSYVLEEMLAYRL